MNWIDLLQLHAWTPVSAIGIEIENISENVKKIGHEKYLFVVDSDLTGNDEDSPYVTMVMWSESDGAALRAADGALEADEEVVVDAMPASVLLPPGSAPEYDSILAGLRRRDEDVLESAEYRITTDGAFLHKVIRGERASYFFRHQEIVTSEKPFAVMYRLS